MTQFWFSGNLVPMKTTLDIDDELYRQAKAAAALSGRKMKDLVSDGLRLVLNGPTQQRLGRGSEVLGLLQKELKGQSIAEIMDGLRGPVDAVPPAQNGRH